VRYATFVSRAAHTEIPDRPAPHNAKTHQGNAGKMGVFQDAPLPSVAYSAVIER
jgi:hypothetical protein